MNLCNLPWIVSHIRIVWGIASLQTGWLLNWLFLCQGIVGISCQIDMYLYLCCVSYLIYFSHHIVLIASNILFPNSIKEAVTFINAIDVNKFARLISRILQKLHLKVQKDFTDVSFPWCWGFSSYTEVTESTEFIRRASVTWLHETAVCSVIGLELEIIKFIKIKFFENEKTEVNLVNKMCIHLNVSWK